MADANTNTRKNKTIRVVSLAVTGLLMAATGMYIGGLLSESPVPDSQENTVEVNGNPQMGGAAFSQSPFDETATEQAATEAGATNSPAGKSDGQSAAAALADQSLAHADEVMNAFGNAPSAPSADGLASTDPTDPITNQIALADEQLRAGSYVQAQRAYTFARQHVDGLAQAAVQYRIALCSEAAGNFREASTQYQQISRSFSATTWAAVARLGEARCLAALGRVDSLAAGILRHALLDQSLFSPRIRGELLHVSGRAFCQSFMPRGIEHLLDDDGMVMPQWVTDPNRQLELLPEYLRDEPLPKRSVTFTILQQTDQFPDTIYVRAHTPISDLKSLITAVTKRSGFDCHFSEAAIVTIAGRTQQAYVDDISLSLLLDGLCAPFGLIWWHEANGIHVMAATELDEAAVVSYRRAAGKRLLSSALVVAPDSSQAGFSRVSLGILQFQNGSPVDAAYTFQLQMELMPHSSVDGEAAHNLAKCYLATAQLDRAKATFLKVVDSSTHNFNAQIGAYLYVGRLQVEQGRFQPAVSSLVRALAICRGTEFEPRAALMLSSAYLMAESPQGASSVLMERREAFDDQQQRNAAAFLSSMSRFDAAVLPGKKERAARALVTALSQLKPDRQFGAHWYYLHALACEELGLTDQAIEGFTETIKRLPAAPLRDRAMVKLANQYRFDNRLDEAAGLLAGINADRSGSLGQHITIQAAQVALDKGDGPAAVQHCRYVVGVTEDEQLQRVALRLMGRAYELQQNHKAAVYCFAGMLPAADAISLEEKATNAAAAAKSKSADGEAATLPSGAIDMTDYGRRAP